MILLASMLIILMDLPRACPEGTVLAQGTCMDRFEAPNIEGRNPMVMQSALDGEKWCGHRGKRLCTEDEWDRVCESSNKNPCLNIRPWVPWNEDAFFPGADWKTEVKRIWQGQPSGSWSDCKSPEGVYDLIGSIEEWVASRDGRDYPYTLKGGFWAKKTSCQQTNDAHHPSFRFYETGFRCCADPHVTVDVDKILSTFL